MASPKSEVVLVQWWVDQHVCLGTLCIVKYRQPGSFLKGVHPTCYLLSSVSIHAVMTLFNALPVAEENTEAGDCGGRERSE